MPLAIEAALARMHKYATRESGDAAEIVERPNGGVSLLIVDGQGSGRGARVISQLLVARSLALLKDGVRDGVVARAANDVLLAQRHGQVSATLDLVSADLAAGEVVVTRQGGTIGAIRSADGVEPLATDSPPLGRYRLSRPVVWRFPVAAGLTVVVTSDGITGSGQRLGHEPLDLCRYLEATPDGSSAQEIADGLLTEALRRDGGRAGDDCTVGVLRLTARDDAFAARRASIYLPVV